MQGYFFSNVVGKNVCFAVLPQHQGHVVPLNSRVSCECIGSTCVQCDACVCVCDVCLHTHVFVYMQLYAHVVVCTRGSSSSTNELSFGESF